MLGLAVQETADYADFRRLDPICPDAHCFSNGVPDFPKSENHGSHGMHRRRSVGRGGALQALRLKVFHSPFRVSRDFRGSKVRFSLNLRQSA
jgi:hypothetical protein